MSDDLTDHRPVGPLDEPAHAMWCDECGNDWPCAVGRVVAELAEARDEIARLQHWKAEAIELLDQWDKVHDALGAPARLGESKAGASMRRAERLNAVASPRLK